MDWWIFGLLDHWFSTINPPISKSSHPIAMKNQRRIKRFLAAADQAFLQKVQAVVEKHLDDERFSGAMLSQEVGLSYSQIHRKLRALAQQSEEIGGMIESVKAKTSEIVAQASSLHCSLKRLRYNLALPFGWR